MKVTFHEATVVISEVVQMLEQKGVDLSTLNTFEDYDDLENLVVSHNNQQWNSFRQEWVDKK